LAFFQLASEQGGGMRTSPAMPSGSSPSRCTHSHSAT
jgi:hypothetical protein